MRSHEISSAVLAAAFLVAGCAAPLTVASDKVRPAGLGVPITEQALIAWNIDVRTTDGAGLPPGAGSVAAGKVVYEGKCLACHGEGAKGGTVFGPMVGGIGSFKTDKRVLTPGSMYPFAPVLFDYVRRAMPMNEPQSLSNDETYAVTAYLLHLNGLLPADAVMTPKSLPAVQMPNREGFIVDDRPDTKAVRCMSNCLPISGKS
jgi:mono/diheme cytochrome c family protein